MTWLALRMLTGDRSKYLALVFGVTFATLLMTQQVSIFMGILTRTGNQILEVRDAEKHLTAHFQHLRDREIA